MATQGRSFPGGEEEGRYRLILDLIGEELERAYAKHGTAPWGRHEFYAILQEEVDELWTAIKEDYPTPDVVKEAVQIGAMVCRYLETGDRYRGAIPLGRCWCSEENPHRGEVPFGGVHWHVDDRRDVPIAEEVSRGG